MLIGYARVSTQQQETALQLAALKRADVKRIVQEKRSGGRGTVRPLLDALLDALKPGDVLLVYKIDRLARSLVDLLRILERVSQAGATFRSLTEPLETETPVGRMMLQLLGALAEFERAVIRERCEAGRIAARQRGVRFGRPPALTAVENAQCQAAVLAGEAVASVARRLCVHRSTVERALR